MPRKPSFTTSDRPPAAGLNPNLPPAAPPSLTDPSLPYPKLIVFDLDYTLWPFWVDTHVTPPLKFSRPATAAVDRAGESFAFFPDVDDLLRLLPALPAAHRIRLAVASRTSAPSLARDLLKGLHLRQPSSEDKDKDKGSSSTGKKAIDVVDGGLEMYPGSKIKHLEALAKKTGVAFEDMLFFDDEARNRDTESLGLTMRLVRDGVTWDEVGKGVEEWRKRRGL